MIESKEQLTNMIKLSLSVAESLEGELKEFFIKQAKNQKERLNGLVKPKPRKKK